MTTEPLDLAAIKARLAAATPGPWPVHPDKYGLMTKIVVGTPGDQIRIVDALLSDDAEFIAHAPADIASLIEAVEARDRVIDDLRIAQTSDGRDYVDAIDSALQGVAAMDAAEREAVS